MKLIYMGTPDFAAVILEKLIEAGHEIALVVTQPDRPKGRKGEPAPSDVKVVAMEHGLPVFQPEKIRLEENVARILEIPCDAIVVAAFGQILPLSILEYPKYGCINVHASLLPKYRGAAPIQWALLNGEEKTGVTIMQMGEGLDDGDMLYVKELPIRPDHTGGKLFDELAVLGGEAIVEALEKIDELKPVPQEHEKATKVGKIKKEMGRIDFAKPATDIERQIRALNPWPSAFCYLGGKMIKLWSAAVLSENAVLTTGEIGVKKDRMFVGTGNGTLEILELQPEGKKRMETAAFLRGYKIEEKTYFE